MKQVTEQTEINLIQLKDRNRYINFDDKNNIGKWFTYTTDFPKKDAKHIAWFDYGIYAGIEHFNTDESDRLPKDRCLNKLMYNKWIVEVVVRQFSGPSLQVVPFEESLCNTEKEAINVVCKYVNLYQQSARDAQIDHMNTFKTNSLT